MGHSPQKEPGKEFLKSLMSLADLRSMKSIALLIITAIAMLFVLVLATSNASRSAVKPNSNHYGSR
jgi:hypothetical protein